jgi:uncharacterized membrane protein
MNHIDEARLRTLLDQATAKASDAGRQRAAKRLADIRFEGAHSDGIRRTPDRGAVVGNRVSSYSTYDVQGEFAGVYLVADVDRGAINLLIGAALGGFQTSQFTTMSVTSIVYLAIFGTLVGYTSYAYLLRNVKLTTAATYAYVNPVVAVLLGWLILGEALAAGEWVGLLVVLLSVAIVISAKPKVRIVSTAPAFGDSLPDPIAAQPSRP